MTAQASTREGASPSGTPPVAVIGAGPVGLAAAADLLGPGLDVAVLERAEQVVSGTLAAAGLGGRAVAPFSVELAHAQMSYGRVLLALVSILLVGAVVFGTTSRAQRVARPPSFFAGPGSRKR